MGKRAFLIGGKESAYNTGHCRLIPGLGRSPGEGKGYPPVFWPGEFHGLYTPWGHKELDTTFTKWERKMPICLIL